MRRGHLSAATAISLGLACQTAPLFPAPKPDLPGTLLGSFAFTLALVPAGQDAGVAGMPATTCVLSDGGGISGAPFTSFYAYVSADADAGRAYWQPLNGPVEDGGLSGASIFVQVASSAPMPGCGGCVGAVLETVVAFQTYADGGGPTAFSLPVLGLSGWLDDRLSSDPNPPNQAPVCEPDAGPGCGLGCDFVYTLSGAPGEPGS